MEGGKPKVKKSSTKSTAAKKKIHRKKGDRPQLKEGRKVNDYLAKVKIEDCRKEILKTKSDYIKSQMAKNAKGFAVQKNETKQERFDKCVNKLALSLRLKKAWALARAAK